MSKIITFYSYKGGVGRTMCLANVGHLLYTWGYKVLLVDWDLEAPGLENFFPDIRLDAANRKGLIDLLSYAAGRDPKKKEVPLVWHDCCIEIEKSTTSPPSQLDLISAGLRDEHYQEKVRTFDVKSFYANSKGGNYIENLRNQWKEKYDFVLIDSRTGITDTSGICTIQLPDILVLLFTATQQGFNGICKVAESAVESRRQFRDRTSLLTLPIPTRFDNSEKHLTEKWLNVFAMGLTKIYATWVTQEVEIHHNIDKSQILTQTKIPYISFYSYGESLPVKDKRNSFDPGGIAYAYQTISALIATNLNYPDLLVNSRDQLLKIADKHNTSQILISLTPTIKEHVTRHSSKLSDIYNYILTEALNSFLSEGHAKPNELRSIRGDDTKNERKDLEIAINVNNRIVNLTNIDLFDADPDQKKIFIAANVESITKSIAAFIINSIKIDHAIYIDIIKDEIKKIIFEELATELDKIEFNYYPLENIETAALDVRLTNVIKKKKNVIIEHQTKWLSFELSKKVNDRLSYYIEERISTNEIEADKIFETYAPILSPQEKYIPGKINSKISENNARKIYKIILLSLGSLMLIFMAFIYFKPLKNDGLLKNDIMVLRYKDSASVALRQGNIKLADEYYVNSVKSALLGKDTIEAISILNEQVDTTLGTGSTSANVQLKKLLSSKHYKVDIFYNYADSINSSRLAKVISDSLKPYSNFKVSLRLLSKGLIDKYPAYQLKNNLIRYDRNDISEKSVANIILRIINSIGNLDDSSRFTTQQMVSKNSPQYISVFVINSNMLRNQASCQELFDIINSRNLEWFDIKNNPRIVFQSKSKDKLVFASDPSKKLLLINIDPVKSCFKSVGGVFNLTIGRGKYYQFEQVSARSFVLNKYEDEKFTRSRSSEKYELMFY